MTYAFKPSDPVSLAISEDELRFPVRRIFCIGKNYASHVIEMGGEVDERHEPSIFTKAPETLVESGSDIPFPPNTENLHYEVELVVAIGPEDINGGIFGYAVGIDMTRRDIQQSAKTKGQPWDRAKNFPNAAPCSKITRAKDGLDMSNARIVLRKNGEIVQSGSTAQMIWSIEEIMTKLREDMDLKPGDLIYTGTPDGVGPVIIGDVLSAGIEGLERLSVRFV